MQSKIELVKKVWDRIEGLIERWPVDGISAEGGFNQSVYNGQRAYVNGMEMGRLAAINVIKEMDFE